MGREGLLIVIFSASLAIAAGCGDDDEGAPQSFDTEDGSGGFDADDSGGGTDTGEDVGADSSQEMGMDTSEEDGAIDVGADGGGEPVVDPVSVDVSPGSDGNVLADTTIDANSGGSLLLPEGVRVNTFDGDQIEETITILFDDRVPEEGDIDFTPDLVFEIGATLASEETFVYFGEPVDRLDYSPGLQVEVTVPGGLLGDLTEGQSVFLSRDLNDIEETPGDIETESWSYLGIFVADENGDVAFSVSHVGTYAVVLETADDEKEDVIPPANGFETTYAIDGHVRTVRLIESTTSQILAAKTYEPTVYDPDRGRWLRGGAPGEEFYFKVTENPDGTSVLHVRSEFTNQPRIRIGNTDGHVESGLMDPIKEVTEGDVGDEVEPDVNDKRAGFLRVRVTGVGELSDIRALAQVLRERYGDENVIIDYFHRTPVGEDYDRIYANLRIRNYNNHDHAVLAKDYLADNGYTTDVYAGAIAGGETVTALNSNVVLVDLAP